MAYIPSPRAKVVDSKVANRILVQYKNGMKTKDLMEYFGLGKATIQRILREHRENQL